MSSSARLFQLILIAASLLHPRAATADPVQITNGFLESVGLSAGGSFQLIGDDFLAIGTVEPGVVWPALLCSPCLAGVPVDLSSRFVGFSSLGPAVFEGTSYPQVRWDGQLFFDAPTVPMPPTAGVFSLTERFTFHGELIAYSSLFEDIIAFQTPLTGQGTLVARFQSLQQPAGPPLIDFQEIRYDFVEPVPEPGTLLLVATGLGAALRARSRARCHNRAG